MMIIIIIIIVIRARKRLNGNIWATGRLHFNAGPQRQEYSSMVWYSSLFEAKPPA